MNSHWRDGLAFATLAITFAGGLVHPLLGQAVTHENIAAAIDRTVRDTELVSPVSGVPVSRVALRLIGETITAQTADVRLRMARALSQSDVRADAVEDLLKTLSGLGTEPTVARVQVAEMAFNQFVNAASPSFLVNPPPEFLALHAVLLRLADVSTNGPERREKVRGM